MTPWAVNQNPAACTRQGHRISRRRKSASTSTSRVRHVATSRGSGSRARMLLWCTACFSTKLRHGVPGAEDGPSLRLAGFYPGISMPLASLRPLVSLGVRPGGDSYRSLAVISVHRCPLRLVAPGLWMRSLAMTMAANRRIRGVVPVELHEDTMSSGLQQRPSRNTRRGTVLERKRPGGCQVSPVPAGQASTYDDFRRTATSPSPLQPLCNPLPSSSPPFLPPHPLAYTSMS